MTMRKASLEIIIPFIEEIKPYLEDPEVSEIMINNSRDIFIEKRGELKKVDRQIENEKKLLSGVKLIARNLNQEINDKNPIVDTRFPDGSRVAIAIPPCSHGITLTIRKFYAKNFTMADLIRIGTLPENLAEQLTGLVENKKNILISGGTGTGKTTLLNILSDFIPDEERLIIIEDTSEIQIRKPNVVRFEALNSKEKGQSIYIRDLVKASLRHRPDRIILGEIRGEEAFDLLQALNTGHSGSMSTIHANNSFLAISRLASCVLQAKVDLPYYSIKQNIADAIDYIIHIERRKNKRFITEVLNLKGYNQPQDKFEIEFIYKRGEL